MGGGRSGEKGGSRVGGRKKREEVEESREWEKGEKEEEEWRVAFWNVAGLRGKDENFWRELSEWEVIVLSET